MSACRWAILGAGGVARSFAADLRLAPGATVVAACARTPSRVEAFVADVGGTAFTDRDTMLGAGGIDAVYVATPNDRHAADTIACLEAGVPVLCEKPFALSAVQAQAVVETARRTGVFCMEAMWSRFIPTYLALKERLDAGDHGTVQGMWADFSMWREAQPGDRFFTPERGGGSLLDLGIYGISLAAFLCGPIVDATGHAVLAPSGVDQLASVSLRHASGAVSMISSSLRAAGPNRLVLATDTATIDVPGPICNPSRFSVTDPTVGPVAGGRFAFLKRHPVTATAYRAARTVVRSTLRRPERETLRWTGAGYQFEADEVQRCLEAGRTESATMPLDETVALMQIMDGLRRDWGVEFPGEDTIPG